MDKDERTALIALLEEMIKRAETGITSGLVYKYLEVHIWKDRLEKLKQEEHGNK